MFKSMRTLIAVVVTCIATAGAGSSASADAVPRLKPTGAEVTVVCPLTVGGSFEAKTRDVRGELTVRAGEPGVIDGAIQVDLQTLQTGIGLRDRHMRENYLEVQKGPEYAVATLEEIRLDRMQGTAALTGTLLLHGQRRTVTGRAEIRDSGGRIQVQAEFPLRVADFEIPKPSYLGVGVREEVRVKVTLALAPAAVASR